MSWVVLCGRLQDGIHLYGPFESRDEAVLWADKVDDTSPEEACIGAWEVIELKDKESI